MEDEGGVDRAPGKDRRLTLPGSRGLSNTEFGESKGIPAVYPHVID
jgi:hypothetical protein